MKRIIIIGGMGPQASLELHRRIIERAAVNGAQNGKDFPHIVHFSLPVDDFIADARKKKAALALIIESLKGFRFATDDIVVIACNTAHLLKDDIEKTLGITIISLIDLTVNHIVKNYKEIRLIASPTTIQTSLYTHPLSQAGIKVRVPSQAELLEVESAIRSVIALKTPKPLRSSNIPVLLGCTELSCVFGNTAGTIDPLNIFIDTLMPRKEML